MKAAKWFTSKWVMEYEHKRKIRSEQAANKASSIRAASPKPEPIVRHEPLVEKNAKGSDPRRRVTITSYRVRLLDQDNLCIKYHIDGLRYEGVIKDDTTQHIVITMRQVQVKTRVEERTEIEVKPG